MQQSLFRLRVKQGPEKGHKHKIRQDRLVLGSQPPSDVIIPVDTVDPQHARLTFDGERLILEDLGSRHGTFRNGNRLLAPLQVFPGDRIGLGPDVILILEGDDPSAAPEREEHDPNLGLAHNSTSEG